jgi:hypothetical protein
MKNKLLLAINITILVLYAFFYLLSLSTSAIAQLLCIALLALERFQPSQASSHVRFDLNQIDDAPETEATEEIKTPTAIAPRRPSESIALSKQSAPLPDLWALPLEIMASDTDHTHTNNLIPLIPYNPHLLLPPAQALSLPPHLNKQTLTKLREIGRSLQIPNCDRLTKRTLIRQIELRQHPQPV